MTLPYNYPTISAPTVAPASISATALQAPMVQGVPGVGADGAACQCGAGQSAFLGMPGVDLWSFSTWPYALKVGTGVVAAYGVYKLAMR